MICERRIGNERTVQTTPILRLVSRNVESGYHSSLGEIDGAKVFGKTPHRGPLPPPKQQCIKRTGVNKKKEKKNQISRSFRLTEQR